MKNTFKLLLIGGITHSKATYEDGVRERWGGGIMYGSRAAHQLHLATQVVTIGANDIEPGIAELKSYGIKVVKIDRVNSNNYANDYRGSVRKLYMSSVIEEPITIDDLTAINDLDLTANQFVVLFPLYQEIPATCLNYFHQNQLILLDPSGMTRRLKPKNNQGLHPIEQTHWENMRDYTRADVLKLSDEDLAQMTFETNMGEPEKMQALVDLGYKLVVLTRGSKPTFVLGKNINFTTIPTVHITAKDTAGAGEVFAVSFMKKYCETNDPILAACYANAASSIRIEGNTIDERELEKRTEMVRDNIIRPS